MSHYVLGCVDENCDCIPDCCDDPPPPNVNIGVEKFISLNRKALSNFDADSCCFGPWDVYTQEDGEWVLDNTIYCLSDIYDYYHYGAGVGSGEYKVVLTGNPHDWDALEDNSTPACFWEIDPHEG